jgi:hypothetical protein
VAQPTPSPAAPYVVACHAGQAARAELDAYLATEAEDLRRGLHICLVATPADLGDVADDLRCAILALVETFPELERIDLGALQDAAKLLRNAGRG